MKRLTLFILLLLCSCVTSKKVKDYLAEEEKQPQAEAIVSEWLDRNKEWYADKAARDFPAKDTFTRQIDTVRVPITMQGEYIIKIDSARNAKSLGGRTGSSRYIPKAERPDVTYFEKTIQEKEQVIQQNIAKLETARAELKQERIAHEAIKQQLQETEAERDYWKEKNRKKFWALVVMGVCAVLYVVFKTLASRVRVT